MIIKAGNSVVLSGFVPKDAECKTVGQRNTPLTKFSVKYGEKVVEGGEKEARWMNIVVWGDLANSASSICKGDMVLVAGEYGEHPYTDRDGNEKVAVNVTADFLTIHHKSGTSTVASARPAAAPSPNVEYEEIVSDEDLPF